MSIRFFQNQKPLAGSRKTTSRSITGWTWLKLVAGLLAGLGGLELGRGLLALFTPLVIDYGEMTVAGASEQLRLSGNLRDIYAPPGAPYAMPGLQYPPLFVVLNAAFTALTGLDPIIAERLLAWGCYAASGGLVGWLVWQETRRRWAALVGAGLPFCFWSVIIYVHAARVDPLALWLSLLAAFLYRRYCRVEVEAGGLPQLAGVALIAVLAFFTKQTYLSVSAAIFFDLLLQGREARPGPGRGLTSFPGWRKAALFAMVWLGWAVPGLGLVGWLSEGQFFGIFEAARAGSFIFHLAPFFVAFFLLDHLPLLVVAGVFIRDRWRLRERFWPLYVLFTALTCLTIIKDGAVDYYFNELAYVLSVCIGLALASCGGTAPGRHRPPERWMLPALMVQAVIALGMLIGWSHWKDFDNFQPAYQQAQSLVTTAQTGERQGGKPPLVLVDIFLIRSGRVEQVADYFIYAILLRNNRRDPALLLRDIEEARYSLIIVEYFVNFPASVDEALAKRYNLYKLKGLDGREMYRAYLPR